MLNPVGYSEHDITRKMVSSQTEISIQGNDCLNKDDLRCTMAGSAEGVVDARGETRQLTD